MVAKTIFWYCAIILIYANLRENDGVDLKFFASKEAYQIVRQLEKITEKSGSESSKMREKQILGP